MGLSDTQWDRLLKIRTTGRDDTNSDQYRYPYEPTPYPVLELLGNTGYIGKKNTLLDYGCGKGRVEFFLTYQTRCRAIGIEYNERIYAMAEANQEHAVSGKRVTFICDDAERFQVPEEVDRVYFFNPFAVGIFQKAFARIMESFYTAPREILLFFYYIDDSYLSYLMERPEAVFKEEIDCTGFPIGEVSREKIVVFAIG